MDALIQNVLNSAPTRCPKMAKGFLRRRVHALFTYASCAANPPIRAHLEKSLMAPSIHARPGLHLRLTAKVETGKGPRKPVTAKAETRADTADHEGSATKEGLETTKASHNRSELEQQLQGCKQAVL